MTNLTAHERAVIEELARRALFAKTPGLLEFVPWATPGYKAPTHLGPLVELLERAAKEPIEAVVSVPPRHGKTDTILHWFAWLLLRNPTLPIAYLSYADEIATRKCRRAMRIAQRVGLPLGEKRTQNEWETSAGGVFRATGIGGQLTGDGYRVIVVDDPHKNREEVESPTTRDKVYHAFTDDVYTRREPGGTSVIVVQTRWHTNDLAGRLIEAGWQNVRLPAIDDEGQALAPDMWPLEELHRLRTTLGEYGWASLFQGQPVPPGGAIFKRQHAGYYKRVPADPGVWCISVDASFKGSASSDFVAMGVWAFISGKFYLVDLVRERMGFRATCDALKTLAAAYPHVPAKVVEEAANGNAIAEALERELPGIVLVKPMGGKEARAHAVSGYWEAGDVMLPEGKPWLLDFLLEVTTFPTAAHDDMVDQMTQAITWLAGHGFGQYAAGVRAAMAEMKGAGLFG